MKAAESNSEMVGPIRQVPAGLKTEPMTIKALAKLFKINRNKMKLRLTYMQGAEKFEGKWRVPLSECPPQYFAERNISVISAIECHRMHDTAIKSENIREN